MVERRNIRKIIFYDIIVTYLTFLYEYDYFRSKYSIEISWNLALVFAGVLGGLILTIGGILYAYYPRKQLFGRICIYIGVGLFIVGCLAIFGLLLFSSRILIVPNLFPIIFGGLYFAILFLYLGYNFMHKLKLGNINLSLILFITGLIILIPSIISFTYSLNLTQILPVKDDSIFLKYIFIGVGLILTIIGGYFFYNNFQKKER